MYHERGQMMKQKKAIIKTNVGFATKKICIREEQLIGKSSRMYMFWITESDGTTHRHGPIWDQSLFSEAPAGVHLADALSWFKKINEVRTK